MKHGTNIYITNTVYKKKNYHGEQGFALSAHSLLKLPLESKPYLAEISSDSPRLGFHENYVLAELCLRQTTSSVLR